MNGFVAEGVAEAPAAHIDADAVSVKSVVDSLLGEETVVEHEYDIVEHIRVRELFECTEVNVKLDIKRRGLVFEFTGTGENADAAYAQIAISVRREYYFWRFCLGSNKSESTHIAPIVPPEKRYRPQFYPSNMSAVVSQITPATMRTRPHKLDNHG